MPIIGTMKNRKDELEHFRKERRRMLELKDEGKTLEEIRQLVGGGSTQAVSARISLARKERTAERRAATRKANLEQAEA